MPKIIRIKLIKANNQTIPPFKKDIAAMPHDSNIIPGKTSAITPTSKISPIINLNKPFIQISGGFCLKRFSLCKI